MGAQLDPPATAPPPEDHSHTGRGHQDGNHRLDQHTGPGKHGGGSSRNSGTVPAGHCRGQVDKRARTAPHQRAPWRAYFTHSLGRDNWSPEFLLQLPPPLPLSPHPTSHSPGRRSQSGGTPRGRHEGMPSPAATSPKAPGTPCAHKSPPRERIHSAQPLIQTVRSTVRNFSTELSLIGVCVGLCTRLQEVC